MIESSSSSNNENLNLIQVIENYRGRFQEKNENLMQQLRVLVNRLNEKELTNFEQKLIKGILVRRANVQFWE